MTYRFGPFQADRTTYRVFEGERPLDLTPKLLDLLFHFLEHPATLVTKEALLDAVWPGANVTDNALAQAVSDLRDALSDEPASPKYIRTVARRGYRFVAAVTQTADDARQHTADGAPMTPATTRTRPHTAAHASGEGEAAEQSIAVLDFINVSGDADTAWLGAGIAETVSSDLTALDRFRVIDRWRVVRAARQAGGSLQEIGAAVGADLVVTGSYQRSHSTLRITARIVDLGRGEAVADAKVDGGIEDVFALQDNIVTAFARELRVPVPRSAARTRPRETASLEAYRAYIEGWLKIESLDTDLVDAAVADFHRAIAIDPDYAMAHTGLANAEFVAFEMTRMLPEPAAQALASGITHARHAIRLDEGLAEAHATLSFLLVSACDFEEAGAAAERAVVMEPENWRHQYRLGHACWGATRVRALEHALQLYPQFAYAQFELAIVHVARGRLDKAEELVREGAHNQDRQTGAGNRFPAIGFRWLLGALLASRGNHAEAMAEFDREVERADRRLLYGPEYGAQAAVWRGYSEIALDAPDRAAALFRDALIRVPDFPRAWQGLELASRQLGDHGTAAQAASAVRQSISKLERTNRKSEARLLGATTAVVEGNRARALELLEGFVTSSPASFQGWTLPLEPLLRPLTDNQGFQQVLAKLAERAS